MLFTKKKIIGLDIGTSTIKLAELDVARRKATLVSYGMIPTPPQATSAGDIIDPRAISETVRQLIDEVKTKRKHVAAGLWGTSVIVKRISIPRMDQNLISEQIRWEAEQYIPYDINDVNLDFKVLNTQSGTAETMDILLIAAVQDMIYRCVDMVEGAGLACEVLDVEGFALANCFETNYGRFDGQVIGLLNIGSSVTNFVVVENGEVVFCRDIPVGGATYTNEISKTLGLSFEEAEGIKISACSGQPAPEDATQVLQSTHEVLCEEINGSVEFFLNTTRSAAISQTFVTGGCIKVPGLIEQLSQNFSCERLDPFFAIKINDRTFPPDYIDQIRDFSAIAVGLGLRGSGDS